MSLKRRKTKKGVDREVFSRALLQELKGCSYQYTLTTWRELDYNERRLYA